MLRAAVSVVLLGVSLACAAPPPPAPVDCEALATDEERPPECWPPSREASGAFEGP